MTTWLRMARPASCIVHIWKTDSRPTLALGNVLIELQLQTDNYTAIYRTRSNLWNVLIIGTQNFNYLIRSNSWNE